MLQMFWTVFKGIFALLKYPVYFILICFAIFVFLCCIWVCIRLAQGKRFKKGEHYRLKKPSILKRLFIQLPRQYVDDMFEREPDFFKYQGLIIFEGRQGSGKTSSLVKFMQEMQEEYPKAKCITNLAYTHEDKPLKDWRMLVNYKNGIHGVIVGMDELQNWFSSNDSKNFPPEMLEVITQNRKNRRIILGTTQNFYLLSKAIRSQTTEVRRCATLLGCLTIVKRLEPILDSEGNVAEWKNRGFYFYVHDKKLRESYNTWKVIERLNKVGFKEEQPTPEITTNTYVINRKK